MYIKPNVSKVDPAEKGAANGIATLDSSGIVPSTQLPTLGTASAKDVPTSGNASTTQVVMGNDTRLTDSRNAADVSAWAKASTKPSYSASEITNLGLLQVYKPTYSTSNRTYTMTEGKVYVIVGTEIGLNGYRSGVWLATYSNVNTENIGSIAKLLGSGTAETHMEVSATGNILNLIAGWTTAWTVYELINSIA